MLIGISVGVLVAVVIGIWVHNAWVRQCLDSAGPYGVASGLLAEKKHGVLHIKYAWDDNQKICEPSCEPSVDVVNVREPHKPLLVPSILKQKQAT